MVHCRCFPSIAYCGFDMFWSPPCVGHLLARVFLTIMASTCDVL